MKIVVLGDIGNSTYHAGDELMARAAVDELSRRSELVATAISADAARSRAMYGWPTVARIGFAGMSTESREARLEAIDRAAGGDAGALPWGDPAWDVIHSVADSDAVLITGGGNLNSVWPEHIYERAALARLAAAFARPLVVTGQTVGPHLTARHGELVGEVVTSAVLVGVRELASREICLRLGVPPHKLCANVDDASFVADRSQEWSPPSGRYIAATFARDSGLVERDRYVLAAADLLRYAHEASGWPVVLVPHLGNLEELEQGGDTAVHGAIVEAAGLDAVRSLPMRLDHELAAARGAALVLSSRYHPVVFALAAGVPTVGLGLDRYTDMKISGAMANMGVADFALGPGSLVTQQVRAAVDEAITRADEISAHLVAVSATREQESGVWWDTVAAALRGDQPDAPPGLTPVSPLEAGSWAPSAHVLREWTQTLSSTFDDIRLDAETAREELVLARRDADEVRLENAALRSELDDAADEAAALRDAADAAYELSTGQLAEVLSHLKEVPTAATLRAELDALQRTRTFRYLAGPRRIWGAVRRRAAGA